MTAPSLTSVTFNFSASEGKVKLAIILVFLQRTKATKNKVWKYDNKNRSAPFDTNALNQSQVLSAEESKNKTT